MPHLLLWVLIEFTRKSFNRECFVSCNFFCATLDKQKPCDFRETTTEEVQAVETTETKETKTKEVKEVEKTEEKEEEVTFL